MNFFKCYFSCSVHNLFRNQTKSTFLGNLCSSNAIKTKNRNETVFALVDSVGFGVVCSWFWFIYNCLFCTACAYCFRFSFFCIVYWLGILLSWKCCLYWLLNRFNNLKMLKKISFLESKNCFNYFPFIRVIYIANRRKWYFLQKHSKSVKHHLKHFYSRNIIFCSQHFHT